MKQKVLKEETANQIVCITNRHLTDDLLKQIEKVTALGVKTVILREKDLQEQEYEMLAEQVLQICRANGTKCIYHNFYETAFRQRPDGLHLPISAFCSLSEEQKRVFPIIGVSVHSAEEARLCEKLGASYLMAGHIFETDCKKGLKPRGLDFLKEICESVSIPVYAVGGINFDNMDKCIRQGAQKVCMMSYFMNESKVIVECEKS